MRERVEVRVDRRLEWVDTDASGHQHNSTILRWVESAEAELMRDLQLPDYFPAAPRVKQTVTYHRPLWFGDHARVHVWIDAVGRTSMTMGFEVRVLQDSSPGEVVARGEVVVAHTDASRQGASPWPEHMRAAWEGHGAGVTEESADRADS